MPGVDGLEVLEWLRFQPGCGGFWWSESARPERELAWPVGKFRLDGLHNRRRCLYRAGSASSEQFADFLRASLRQRLLPFALSGKPGVEAVSFHYRQQR